MKKFLFIVCFAYFLKATAQISDFKNINFTKADNIAKLHEGESLKNLALLTHKLTSNLSTDIEKFRAIYTWVCTNITGNYELSQKIINKSKKLKNNPKKFQKWHASIAPKVFKKLQHQKSTMCTGYAYLIKELAYIANIECKIINGYGRTLSSNINTFDLPNHSWNAVKLNNKWYLCDATWSSGYINDECTFIFEYNDGYFLTTPFFFAKNHFPTDSKWLLNNQQTKQNFIKGPLLYNEAFKHSVFPVSPSKMETEVFTNESVSFKLESVTQTDIKMILKIDNGIYVKSVQLKNINPKKDGVMIYKYSFKKKGHYDVHLQLLNDIIATYVFTVKEPQE